MNKYLILLLVLLLVPIFASAEERPEYQPCVGTWDCIWKNPDWYSTNTTMHQTDSCKELHNLVLVYLELADNQKHLTYHEDRMEDKLDAIFYSIKADTYMRLYLDGCGANSTWRERELVDEVVKIERETP